MSGFSNIFHDLHNLVPLAHYACPHDCKIDDSSKRDGDYVVMLEYDPNDDSLPNAGESEHDKALAAVHEFQCKEKLMSDVS